MRRSGDEGSHTTRLREDIRLEESRLKPVHAQRLRESHGVREDLKNGHQDDRCSLTLESSSPKGSKAKFSRQYSSLQGSFVSMRPVTLKPRPPTTTPHGRR